MDAYQLTKESDVYSFGVVLFEVLCGRVCYERSNGTLQVFVHFWKTCYEQKKLDDIIFPDLKHQLDPRSVETFVGIAYQCLQKSREQRPTMSVIVEKLKAALEFKVRYDLKLQREHEQEQMGKAAGYEYREILKLADPPLIYKSVKELKAVLSKGFRVNGHKTWLSLNKKGEHREMLSIAHCLSPREGGYTLYCTDVNARFPCFFYTSKKGFKVRVRTQFLTPSIGYTVNLMLLCKDDSSKKQKYVALIYKLEGETQTSIVYLATKTKDNLSYIIKLYQFTSNGSTFDLDIVFEDHEDDLRVEGILFQPIEKVEHEQVLEDEGLLNGSLQWRIKKDPFSNRQEGYFVDSNEKKSFKLLARSVIKCDYGLSFRSSSKSRFGEVAVVTNGRFNINKEIDPDVASPETTYACYLVYNLPQEQYKFKGHPLQITRTNKGVACYHVYQYIYLVSPPETPFIGQKLDQSTHSPFNRSKLNAFPRQRSDGWMEVKVSEYQTRTSLCSRGQWYPQPVVGDINIGLQLQTPDDTGISGLIIESIELRPIVVHSA